MRTCKATPKVTPAAVAPDPRGRLDVLLLRIGDQFAGKIEQRFGVDLWAGPGGIRSLIEEHLQTTPLAQPIDFTPAGLVKIAGAGLGNRKRRRGR